MVVSDQKKFRIILWGVSTSGWRDTQAAVVYDAKSIGVEEHANDSGSAYWTLNNDHPQIAEFQPLRRHYEISRWTDSRNRWEFVGAGILNDYTVTEYETTFSGIDYKAVLNQIYTPLTSITFSSSSPLNPNLATASMPTVFNTNDGSFSKDNINGSLYNTASQAYYDYIGGADFTINSVSISAVAETTKTIVADARTASVLTPYIRLTYSATWNATTTASFLATPQWRMRVNASPPGQIDAGNSPIGEYGKLAEFSTPADGSTGTSRFAVTNRTVDFYPYEAKQELRSALVALGASTTAIDSAMPDAVSVTGISASNYTTGTVTGWSLRKGLTYAFQIYAAIHRTGSGGSGPSLGLPVWYGTAPGSQLPEVTVGQGTENLSAITQRVFGNAKTTSASSRIRYASLTVSGSTYTTHTTYSAGQPTMDYIADLCDLEMGARGGGSKAIFGIDKPAPESSYTGNFKLTLNVSSSAITTGPSLRYPENIRTYSFSPGFAKVRNNITIIPTEKYLSGSTAQGSGGAQIIGASASDSASIAAYGDIPMVASKGGFINAQSAQNEANRMLTLYGSIDTTKTPSIPRNTKQVALRVTVDGIDPFYNWDVGDSINVSIKHGLVDVSEPFVISGVRWFGESSGYELLELDLVQGSSFAAAFGGGAQLPFSGDGGQSPFGPPSSPGVTSFGGTSRTPTRRASTSPRARTTTPVAPTRSISTPRRSINSRGGQ